MNVGIVRIIKNRLTGVDAYGPIIYPNVTLMIQEKFQTSVHFPMHRRNHETKSHNPSNLLFTHVTN